MPPELTKKQARQAARADAERKLLVITQPKTTGFGFLPFWCYPGGVLLCLAAMYFLNNDLGTGMCLQALGILCYLGVIASHTARQSHRRFLGRLKQLERYDELDGLP